MNLKSILKITYVVIVILSLTSCKNKNAVKFNGAYISEEENTEQWFRFYADNTLLRTSIAKGADPANIIGWFNKCSTAMYEGSFNQKKDNIDFTVSFDDLTLEYEGFIDGNTMTLTYILYDGTTKQISLMFQEFDFPYCEKD